MNPLYELRKDLKPIIEIKKQMDYMNRFTNADLQDGCNEIKTIIIELADKYKEERSE